MMKMPKSNKLKANLRAADKRRKRRVVETKSDASFSSEPKLDIEGLIVDGILKTVANRESRREPNLRDSAVIAALKALRQGTAPNSTEASECYAEICRVLDSAGVSEGKRAKAATQTLSLASLNDYEKSPDQFIRYLSLIAV